MAEDKTKDAEVEEEEGSGTPPPDADSLILRAQTFIIDGKAFGWEEAKAYRKAKREFLEKAAVEAATAAMEKEAENEWAIRTARMKEENIEAE